MKIINTTPHSIRFQRAIDGEVFEVPPCGTFINARPVEVTGFGKRCGAELVGVNFVADEASELALVKLETENPDARVRIRALELLGKMSDVGLFTERSEVVVTHRSTDDLKLSLREKLQKLRSKVAKEEASDAIIDVEAPAPLQNINVEEELGL